MFSVRVHLANQPGHAVYECREYEVETAGAVVRLKMRDGESIREVELRDGGYAYVMGDSGKTVELLRSPAAPRQAKLQVTR